MGTENNIHAINAPLLYQNWKRLSAPLSAPRSLAVKMLTPKLRYFDVLWICCTTVQQIHNTSTRSIGVCTKVFWCFLMPAAYTVL